MSVQVFVGDCMDIMPRLPAESVDVIFTSPPYNLGTTSGGGLRVGHVGSKWKRAALSAGYDGHDDKMPHQAYVEWQRAILAECWRLLKPTGAIFYNNKPRVQNGVAQLPLDYNPGLPLRQIIIWVRNGGINFSPTFYCPQHEWIMLLAKPGFALRDRAASGAGDVWIVNAEQSNDHPAPFPVELPLRALETLQPGVCLDPFMGSGSTGVASIYAGWSFIGIEKSPLYFARAKERLALAQATGRDKRLNGVQQTLPWEQEVAS